MFRLLASMMTSSNGNVFRVTGHLWEEFTGHRWIPLAKASDAELWCFLWSALWISGWVSNREAGDLRRRRAHYDVIVMVPLWVTIHQRINIWQNCTMWTFTNLSNPFFNKANLRDLIAATGLVISNWIQIVNFSARVTVKFDGWPCKTIGHLFYATSSFVHLFVPFGEFKLKFQSGNAQSGSNWMIFRAVRPWNLTDDLAKQ